MKADFEKGTKVCSKCKRELPIEMFHNDASKIDGLRSWCKKCVRIKDKRYRENNKNKIKDYFDKRQNTFGRTGEKRGQSTILKRDYELTEEQLKKRESQRSRSKYKRRNAHGILVWYDGTLNEIDLKLYKRIIRKEYCRQKACAVRGHIGRVKPSEHFLFDFDLEEMLKDNVYCNCGKYRKYITKWWKGEIRHWTVNDGIWKE